MALANVLQQLSDAALVEVSLVYRQPLSVEPIVYPSSRRSRVAIPAQTDAYHAILPVTLDGAYDVIDALYQYAFCTPSGADFLPDAGLAQETEPNWREVAGVVSGKYVLVLDEQLWRDLMITSMALDSASRRIRLDAPSAMQLRRQLTELLKGVGLDEILQRLDEIIAIMQQRADSDTAVFQQIDDVEELLDAIISAL